MGEVGPGMGIEMAMGAALPRRTFLKVAGAGALGLMGAGGALAATPGRARAGQAPDAIFEKALELELDADRIFRFVADEIGYEPYAGVLRGATGTLAGRAGNSVDQALLLAALLEASAIPVRFVQGRLADADSEAIMATTRSDLATARAQRQSVLQGPPRSDPPRTLDLSPEAQALLDSLPAIVEDAGELVEARLDRSVSRLLGTLTGAGISLPSGGSPMPQLERDRHTWVQMGAGADWVDLDPSLPGAAPGTVIATPEGASMATLPDEQRHRVELAIVVERIASGALVQAVEVEHIAFADAIAGAPIAVYHERPASLKAVGVGVESALEGTVRYQPILSVGDEALIGIPGVAFGSGKGALDVLGASSSAEGDATAEWLDVRIVTPEGTTTARRTIFDRVGDEGREAGAVDPAALAPVELVDLADDLKAEFAPMRMVHLLGVSTGMTGPGVLDRIADADADDNVTVLGLAPYLHHLSRDVMGAALGLSRGVRTFLDAPNVVAYRASLLPPSQAAGVEPSTLAIDLLARSFGHLGIEDVAATAPGALLAGVMSHEAERVELGDGLVSDLVPDPEVASVGAIFEEAELQGIASLVLREAAEVEALPFRPEVVARIRPSLAEGWLVVVPERPVLLNGRERVGWWLVDPRTGRTVDVFEDGGGTALPENATLLQKIIYYGTKLICLGFAIKTVFTLAELAIGNYDGFIKSWIVGSLLSPIHHAMCH